MTRQMLSNFSPDFYESILEASNKDELWGIENSDLTPLETLLILLNDYSWFAITKPYISFRKTSDFGMVVKMSILAIFFVTTFIH